MKLINAEIKDPDVVYKKGRSIRIRIETTRHTNRKGSNNDKKGRSIRIRIETKWYQDHYEELSIIKKEDPLE